MDSRVTLLKEFYRGLPGDRIKLETYEHGFPFLQRLLTDGMALEYGELTLSGVLHKYKLVDVSEERLDELLREHVEKKCNVCLYFDETANDTLCFNLDNNHKTNNTVVIPEMVFAVGTLREILTGLGCAPLIIASGRGYHLWCRLSARVENERLYEFMLRAAVKTLARLHEAGFNHRKVKFNLYPDQRIRGVVSLRLFGSEHAKNKVFSQVLTPGGLLDEASSWDYFAGYLKNGTVPADKFAEACTAIGKTF
jgi:hypothetical protein